VATDLNLADDFLWVRCWNAEIHTRADQHIAKLKSEDCFVDHLESLVNRLNSCAAAGGGHSEQFAQLLSGC